MEDAAMNLMTAFIGQIDSAMKISEVISNHSGDDEITPDALITGLVYRLMVNMSNEEIIQSIQRAKQILEGSSSEEDDDIYMEENYDKEIVFSRKVKKNNCNCEICSKARTCLLNFHTHECSDPLAEKYKNAIDHACEKHKLFI
tara:strand:- start:823 stop:1254 length:432 start_codon:yes stop_codon:yes gene_type:complete